jgi:WD40 repeat protein
MCRVREVEVAQSPPPPLFVGLHSGFVFTADVDHGLRAWSMRYHETYLANVSFLKPGAVPTALSATQGSSSSTVEVTVGFEDGTFDVYDLDVVKPKFTLRYSHVTSTAGAITAIASSPPYLMMVSLHKNLCLYKSSPRAKPSDTTRDPPQLLASLEANNILAPISLSIRSSATEIIASIAYNFYHIGCGWSIGIQELHISHDGEYLKSRLATTIDSQSSENNMQMPIEPTKMKCHLGSLDSSVDSSSNASIRHNEPPTSLSYSHPYLLTSHKDNTLTMYLVVSSSEKLAIKGARRLWGHTSSVSGVQVSDRGKAVSVSSRGKEIRIWELETVIASPTASRRAMKGESSVQISPENKTQRNHFEFQTISEAINWGREELRMEPDNPSDGTARMGGWVGFDEEQVVVLRERGHGTQLLECYDFT